MIQAATTQPDAFDRVPPHDLDAEMCLIASVMLDRGAWLECRQHVDRESFYRADHQTIWDVVSDLYDAGKPVDSIIVRAELIKRGVYEDVGGRSYLGQLLATVPTAAHAGMYAQTVAEKSKLRRLICVGNDILRDCFSPTRSIDPASDILQRALNELATAAQAGSRTKAQRLSEMLADVRLQLPRAGSKLVPTGFRDFDNLVGGVGIGEMMLVGARPSMGKSTFARQVWVRAAKAGVPTCIVTLEETGPKIARNVLSAECRIENGKLRRGGLSDGDWVNIDKGIDRLKDLDAFKIEKCRRLQDIAAELSLLTARYGVKLVVIDYLQRVRAGGKDKYEQASNASEGVSSLLKDLGVAGVIPVQLNRGVEQRDEKRPTMADLRDSGQIEQDADGIVFLHREDYYHTDDGDYKPDGSRNSSSRSGGMG
jgi:replicative DNA helicase